MANYTKEELAALGAKLDAAPLTDREREILGRIVGAVTGGEVQGYAPDGELGDSALDSVSGGVSVGGSSGSFKSMFGGIELGSAWSRGAGTLSASQWADATWANSAVVEF